MKKKTGVKAKKAAKVESAEANDGFPVFSSKADFALVLLTLDAITERLDGIEERLEMLESEVFKSETLGSFVYP